MIVKTPNIRCFVAKTHLSQITRFFRRQMSPFYPFRGGVAGKGQCHLFLHFFFIGAFLSIISDHSHCQNIHSQCQNCCFIEFIIFGKIIVPECAQKGRFKRCLGNAQIKTVFIFAGAFQHNRSFGEFTSFTSLPWLAKDVPKV